jgi:uncharacterized RDD family membrane protein YckC
MIAVGFFTFRRRRQALRARAAGTPPLAEPERDLAPPPAAALPRPGPAAPASAAGEEREEEEDLESLASITERLLAFGIDFVLVVACTGWVAAQSPSLATFVRRNIEAVGTPGFLLVQALFFTALTVYFTLFEGLRGWTPGKRLLGLEVRSEEGRPLGLLRSFYRNVFRIEIVFGWLGEGGLLLACLLCFPPMVLTPRRQRAGDLLAGSIVRHATARPLPKARETGEGGGER